MNKKTTNFFIAASLFFAANFCVYLYAQPVTPGNTPYTVEYWLKADEILNGTFLPNNSNVLRWVNHSAKNSDFVRNGTQAVPTYRHGGLNFNPAVTFQTEARKLVSESSFTTVAGTLYRTFYVSTNERAGAATAADRGTLFAYRENNEEGWQGTTLFHRNTAGANNVDPLLNKRYGIVSMERTATAAAATTPATTVWQNAKPVTPATSRTIIAGTATAIIGTRILAATGTSTAEANSRHVGDIQEIIVLSTPVGTSFDPNEIAKINSYLAIKYGQTLESNQPNLFNSAGNLVWSATANSGYTNFVFGIGRDSGTGLNQKQSVNQDDNTLTLFLGNQMFTLSAQNPNPITDMSYLLLGSNNANGNTPYSWAANTAFENHTLTDEFFSLRYNRLYKAQVTGATTITTSLQLKNLRAKYVMVSNSNSFLPSNTRLYPLDKNGMAFNVEINDGDFIGFVITEKTPGGVNAYALELWLKADEVQNGTTLFNNVNVTRWEDLSPNNNDFIQYNSATVAQNAVPAYKYGGMNFNPAVTFQVEAKKLVSKNNFTTEANRTYLAFYVSKNERGGAAAAADRGSLFVYGGTNEDGWQGHTIFHRNSAGANNADPGLNKRDGIVSLQRSATAAAATTPATLMWQDAQPTPAPATSRTIVAGNSTAFIGTRTLVAAGTATTEANSRHIGDIQEVIILSAPTSATPFSATDIQKINSYLAIKYGIHLRNTGDYIISDGTVVWNRGAANNGYHNNIFGIGRDDVSRLNQIQSRSQNSDILTLFKGATLAVLNNNANTTLLSDKTFLMVGSNNLSVNANVKYEHNLDTVFASGTIDYKLSFRTALTYKAQVTTLGVQGGTQIVNMQINSTRPSYVIVSNSTAFLAANTRIYPIVNKLATGVQINDGDFISFAGFEPAPGGVDISTSGYTLDLWVDGNNSTNNSWTNIALSNFTLEGSIHTPTVRNSKLNFHRELNFGNQLNSKLRTTADYNLTIGESYYAFVVSEQPKNNEAILLSYNPTTTDANARRTSLRWLTNSSIRANWNNTTATTSTITNTLRFGISSMNILNTTAIGTSVMYMSGTSLTPLTNMAQQNVTGTRLYIGNGNNNMTSTAAGGRNLPFDGAIQEIIVMRKPAGTLMSATDIAKIHTYLALKYGISLNAGNYIASDGTIVWDRTANTGYNNNIFGIGRDRESGLFQKQAKSASSPYLSIFLGSALTTLNSENNAVMDNEQFVIVGSSGGSIIQQLTTYINPGDIYENGTIVTVEPFNIHSPTFKAQITGFANDSVRIKTQAPQDFLYALVSTDATFTPSYTRIYPAVGGVIEIDLVDNYKYFKYAGFAPGPGGVTNGLRLWLRADDEIGMGVQNLATTLANLSSASTASSTDPLLGYSLRTGDYFTEPDPEVPVVNSWSDVARGHTYSYLAEGYRRIPVFKTSVPEMNFHPSVRFWGFANTYQSIIVNTLTNPMGVNIPVNGEHTAYFMVNNDFSTNAWIYMLSFGALNTGGTGTIQQIPQVAYGVEKLTAGPNNGNITGRFRTSNSDVSASKNLFNLGATSLLGYETMINPNTTANYVAEFQFNGREDCSLTSSTAGDRTFTWAGASGFGNPVNTSILGTGYAQNRGVQGFMSEVILYNRLLSANELRLLESYMSIKYGVTLRPSYNPTERLDYVLSSGKIIWQGNITSGKHVDFYNNIAAVIRDDAARLNNRQAHSTDAGSIMYMGLAGTKLTVSGEFVGIHQNDQEAVVWGCDQVSTIIPMVEEDCGDFDFLFGRIWLVSKYTKDDRPIQMIVAARNNQNLNFGDANAAPQEQKYYNQLHGGNDFFLVIADSPDDIRNKNYKAVLPMNWLDDLHQVLYTFSQEHTYVTFGYRINKRGCLGNPEAEFYNPKRADWTLWKSTTNTKPTSATDVDITLPLPAGSFVDLGDNIGVNTRIQYQGGAYPSGTGVRATRYWPRSVNTPERGSVEVRRRGGQAGNPLSDVIITINFTNPVIPNFYISGLDGSARVWEEVEISGKCDGATYYPMLTYGGAERTSSYKIAGNKATVKRNGSMSATNRNGKVNVEFGGGVTSVTIKYRVINRSNTTTRRIYISPITLDAVFAPPPVNEHGLAFWLNAAQREELLCKEIKYSFYIENINCEEKPVDFSFTLPDDMLWDCNSLSIGDDRIEFADIHCDGPTLTIDNLMLLGADITRFRANAIFDFDAPPGEYVTRARINYEMIVNDLPVKDTIHSYDYMYGNVPTVITALPAPRTRPIEVLDFSFDRFCYSPEDTIKVSITINNPNGQSIDIAALEVLYNEEFTYLDGSLDGNGTLTLSPPILYEDEDDGTLLGGLWLSVLDILEGEHTITFKLIAPITPEPEFGTNNLPLFDESGNPIYAPLFVSFEFFSLDEEDECADEAFRYAYGDIELEAKPIVEITGPTTICIGDISQLSRWTGGKWSSNNPEIAAVDEITGEITGLSGGKATFSFAVDGSGCVAVSDTLTVYEPAISWKDTVYIGVPATFLPTAGGEWGSNDMAIATVTQSGIVSGHTPGRLTFTFTESASGCTATTDSVTVMYPFYVTYVANNGIDPDSTEIALRGYIVKSPDNLNFTRPAGLTFLYWFGDDNKIYIPGDVLDLDDDLVLTAIWSDVWEIWNWEDLSRVMEMQGRGIAKFKLMQNIGTPDGLFEEDCRHTAVPNYGDGATMTDPAIIANHKGDKKFGWYGYEIFVDNASSEGWIPIGVYNSQPSLRVPFTGEFDGNNKVISGLWIDRMVNGQGLFGMVSGASATQLAIIKNLGIYIADEGISGMNNVAGIAAYADNAEITNCYVVGSVTAAYLNAGGLVGSSEKNLLIKNCSFEGDVTGNYGVGGLVGSIYLSTGISDSYSSGTVKGSGVLGGLVGTGYLFQANPGITRCYSTGTVTGTAYTVGGLIGAASNLTISNCYTTGNVEGAGNDVGGLAGNIEKAVITNCYANGNVEGKGNNVGGLVGYAYDNAEISNCYAFNVKITAPATANFGRILGLDFDATTTLNNNYALENMVITGTLSVGAKEPDNENGEDIFACQATTDQAVYTTSYTNWIFPGTWTFNYTNYSVKAGVDSTNLPILSVFTKTNFPCALQPPHLDYEFFTPSIVISGITEICAGESVTFTSEVTYEGKNPGYQWKVNGNNRGTAPTFTYEPINGDVITCVLTSSHPCRTDITTLSNEIIMNVTTPAMPTGDDVQSFCYGAKLTNLVAYTTSDALKWYQYGIEITGNPLLETGIYYAKSLLDDCLGVDSLAVAVTIKPLTTPDMFTALVGDTVVCKGETTTLSPQSSLSPAVYKWYDSPEATVPFYTGASYTTSALMLDTIFYISVSGTLNGTEYCEGNADVTGRLEVLVRVNPLPVVSIFESKDTIRVTQTLTLIADKTGAWVSNHPSIATVTPGGIITGVSPGRATFTFTETLTGCQATSDTVTVLSEYIALNLTLFLQGVTREGPAMTNYLQSPSYDPGLIPDKALPVNNPYTGMPQFYHQINDTLGPAGKVVDWILVEIMTNFDSFSLDGIEYTYYSLLESQALLLKPNGTVVDTNGHLPRFRFLEDGQVRIAIKHRNHLSVITPNLLDFDNDLTYNFSDAVTKALKISWARYQPMEFRNGVWCLYAGDLWNGNATDATLNVINATDIERFNSSLRLPTIWVSGTYMVEDVNMDGMIDSADDVFILPNARQVTQSPLLYFIKRP